MEGLFQEFTELCNHCDKYDHFSALFFLKFLEESLDNAHDNKFLKTLIEDVIGVCIRLWTGFIENESKEIQTEKISSKKPKVLSIILKFPVRCMYDPPFGFNSFFDKHQDFVSYMDSGVENTKIAKGLAHNACSKMLKLITTLLENHKDESMCVLRMINFYYLQENLDIFEYVPLQECKTHFEKNQTLFVENLFKSQFESLLQFFGNMANVNKSIPLKEIQYQQSFSKTSFQKLASNYSEDKVHILFLSSLILLKLIYFSHYSFIPRLRRKSKQ